MRHLFITLSLASLFSMNAFAVGQSSTECPMMREQNERLNTKANLNAIKSKPKSTKSSTAQ